MGVLYMPYFDVTQVADYNGTIGTLTLSDGVHTDLEIKVYELTSTNQEGSGTSTIFAHKGGLAGYIIRASYSTVELACPDFSLAPIATPMRNAIIAAATTESWASPSLFTVSFSTTTARYTIAHPSTSFSMTWSSACTRNLFGFAGDTSAATSHVGTKTPLYCINSTLGDVSQESDFYEPDNIGNHVLADNGAGTGIARTAAPKYKDWVQEYETKLKTHRVFGAQPDGTGVTDPFTHEHLREYCRGVWPFILYGVNRAGSYGVSEVYSLRTDGISFTPIRATPGNDSQFHIPYRCVLVGVIDGVFT